MSNRGQRDELERLCAELTRRERDAKKQKRENARQQRQIDGLEREIDRLERENERLKHELAGARLAGAGKRRRSRRTGRKVVAGVPAGRPVRRTVGKLAADVRHVPTRPLRRRFPASCPDCGGAITVTRVEKQYQEDLPPVRPLVRRFDIEVGHCYDVHPRMCHDVSPQALNPSTGSGQPQSDAALVVDAEFEKGGTWAGAVEQLDRHRFVSVYVRATGEMGTGLDALLARGARRWMNPEDPEALGSLLDTSPEAAPASGLASLPREVRSDQDPADDTQPTQALAPPPIAKPGFGDGLSPAEKLLARVRELLSAYLDEPRSEADVTQALGVQKTQALGVQKTQASRSPRRRKWCRRRRRRPGTHGAGSMRRSAPSSSSVSR